MRVYNFMNVFLIILATLTFKHNSSPVFTKEEFIHASIPVCIMAQLLNSGLSIALHVV